MDLTIQKYATQAALAVMEEKQAKRVAMIIMNPKNGEIYAMVDVPEYDLNHPFQLNTGIDGYESMTEAQKMDALNNMWRNFTVSDTYEPGSTFKIEQRRRHWRQEQCPYPIPFTVRDIRS